MDNTVAMTTSGNLLAVEISGKLDANAYKEFVPVVDSLIQQHGKLRLLVILHRFHGWTAGALWEDLKFDASHWNKIERLAIVGESQWEAGMAVFCKPFTSAKIQYFDHAKIEEAKAWIAAE